MIRWLAFSMLFSFSNLLFGCSAQDKPAASPPPAPASLVGTEWTLQDLAGTPVVADSKASLAFPETGRVAGNASCNRFTGSVTISGDSIKFGAMASTRMACVNDQINNQEMQYLKALEAANRLELKDGAVLIHSQGYDKPLRFTKGAPAAP